MYHKYKGAPTVGWSERDLEWLRAAITLPAFDFLMALDDIASMSGRTIGAIASKAKSLRREMAVPKPQTNKKIPLPDSPLPVPPAFVIRPLDKRDLMAGRARVRPRI